MECRWVAIIAIVADDVAAGDGDLFASSGC